MSISTLFDLESRRYTRLKNLVVRITPEKRQKLQLIATERGWILSKMVNRALDHFIEEYDKLPKLPKNKMDKTYPDQNAIQDSFL